MRTVTNFIKDTLAGGLLFLVPLFVVLILAKKIWEKAHVLHLKLSKMLGIDFLIGDTARPLITILALITICFLSGLLFRLTLFKQFRKRLDQILCRVIPGYEFYKLNLIQKINQEETKLDRRAVLVMSDGIGQPGIIVEDWSETEKVIFFPAKPGTPEGQVMVVPNNRVMELSSDEPALNKILQHQGKGLASIRK